MGVAGAEDDEADEEEWDENAAETKDAQNAAGTGQNKDDEATRKEKGKDTKGARRRRGGKEDEGGTAAPGPEKKRRAPRWSKKVNTVQSYCRATTEGKDGLCMMRHRISNALANARLSPMLGLCGQFFVRG